MSDGALALEGRVALITGAASGIGAAAARSLGSSGAAVAVLDLDAVRTAMVVAQLRESGAWAHPVVADLANPQGLAAHLAVVEQELGPIDILVNCAHFAEPTTSLFDVDMQLWERAVMVNLTAPFTLMRLAARSMVDRGVGGRIVNVASSSAFRAQFSKFAYGAAKAGLVQLTRSVAAELGPHGINVNAVAPGLTRTPSISNLQDPDVLVRSGPLGNLLQRISEPEDVAEVVRFLCLPASRQITAQTIHVSAGAVV